VVFVVSAVWKRTWTTALKYLPDAVEETAWSAQVVSYYECCLGCLGNIMEETQYLVSLTGMTVDLIMLSALFCRFTGFICLFIALC
jgi:hypothetical protein